MKDQQTKDKFVELRAKGWSYQRIATELAMSKQTLINWSKDLEHEIANLRAIELEVVQAKYFALRDKRIKLFGEIVKDIKIELDKRDLQNLATEKLLELLLKYAEALKREGVEAPIFTIKENDYDVDPLLNDRSVLATA